jgi:two-component system chemotaxis sensor kinase CheA
MNEFEKEVKMDFLVEATQLLNDAEQAFLALEGDKNNINLMNEIFRLAHNLKGTSRAVGFGDVAEFTHEMENLILQLKEGRLEITNGIVSLLLECNDHVSVMIKMLNMDLESRFDSVSIIAKIKLALNGELSEEVPPPPPVKTIEAAVEPPPFIHPKIANEPPPIPSGKDISAEVI